MRRSYAAEGSGEENLCGSGNSAARRIGKTKKMEGYDEIFLGVAWFFSEHSDSLPKSATHYVDGN